jgi:hypothetical protein
MAVARLPVSAAGGLVALAVDAARLPAAAAWPDDSGARAAQLAGLLHPAAPEPYLWRGEDLTVDLDSPADAATVGRELVLSFEPLAGGPPVESSTDELRPGRHTYPLDVRGCAAGCRLVGLRLQTARDRAVDVTVRAVGTGAAPLVPAADLADASRWRALERTIVRSGTTGLVIVSSPNTAGAPAGVRVVDAPDPLPVVAAASTAAPAPGGLTGPDGAGHDATVVARSERLPRVGDDGALVDLDLLDRVVVHYGPLVGAEVWLGPAAPHDAVDRLRAAGLHITGAYGVDRELAALSRQGSAVVLWFYAVAAGFAVLLALGGIGLVAAVDRDRRASDLRVLRWQGLSRRDLNRASLWGSLGVVLVGSVLGLGAAWLAWLGAGDRLPVFVDNGVGMPPPRWPALTAVVWPWSLAVALFVAVAVVAAVQVRRSVARNGRDH